ncbi:GNAT family N-acetyltransferase [Pseudomonas sp.]|uniref:GNAT family N-acetyltransferase n=1 Tax=Pseudomonas sp. TaxID=306 RepID=UPI00272FEBD6|nr:GNAT family N-acetyltransferase [Pseudomonas sp.]MDP2243893.1 GNAT family N-acetyltransferase [Pseudomonas sp.]
MPRLHIRSAQRGDVALILGFIRELAEYEKLSDQVVADPAQMTEHLFGARPFAEVLIGEVDGEAAGFALFFHNYSTFLGKPGIHLEDLYVRPSARGTGLGTALLSTLATLAVERGCGRLEWSVLDWNEPAIGFYQRLGAAPLDGWTMYRLTGPALHELSQKTT